MAASTSSSSPTACYSRVKPEDVPEIFEKHLLGGEVVTRLAASAGAW